MGQLAVPLMIASTVVSTFGAYKEAQAQKSQAKYNAAVAQQNAILANQSADYNRKLAEDALERGKTAEYRQRLATRDLAAKQRNTFAAAGVDLSSGSPLDILGDTYMLGELDALTTRNNAGREAGQYKYAAWGNEVEAMNYRASGAQASATAKSISPFMSAAGTALNGTSTVAGKWYGADGKTPWYKRK